MGYSRLLRVLVGAVLFSVLAPAQKYNGPRPQKPDVPYLQHADNLVETEAAEAQQDDRKDDTVYVVAGPSSPARTPMAEPIFIIEARKIQPEKLDLYRFEVKNGSRQIEFPKKKKKDAPRPLRFLVTRLDEGLYRVEVNETLENGEYSLTPAGSNQVFCFEVY